MQVHLSGAMPLLGVQLNAVSLVNLTMVSQHTVIWHLPSRSNDMGSREH